MMRDWVDQHWRPRALLEALFPPTCVFCGAPGLPRRAPGTPPCTDPPALPWNGPEGLDLCAGCLADLPLNDRCCPRCAVPFASAMPPAHCCARCQQQPPRFVSSLAVWRYEGAVPHLVTGAKFRHRLDLLRLLGQCLSARVSALAASRPEVLVPVPLHVSRLRERGYNQALEIARVLSRELGIPIDHHRCRRVLATTPQTGLDERARQRNIRGAFEVESPLPWARVALIDDVVTTGSTVAELSRVLHRAGATEIQVWAVARTP